MTIPFFVTQDDLERLKLEYPGGVIAEDKSWLLYSFPEQKRKIAWLTQEQKMEWYAYQFQRDPRAASALLSTKEFARFWKWQVLIRMKFKRFFYRLKNFELFKKYEHISEMKRKVKKYSI